MRREASIMHLDLDAAFASIEQRDKPSLRGRPVVVGGIAGRGVVATASYEARTYGVRSAMPMAEARRRLPAGAAYLVPRFEAYKRTSHVVMDLLREVSPLVEPVSIDEAFVDLAAGGHDCAVPAVTELARGIKARIAAATGGVTGSVGIGSSKLVAKIASDLDKPDGLTVVGPGRELDTLHPLPVTKLWGVGPATAERLRQAGIRTIGDLAARELVDLLAWFGQAHGTGLHRLARADDDRPVVPERDTKSVSAEETFSTDVADRTVLGRELDQLADRVATRLRAAGLSGRTVTVKARYFDFTTITRSATREQPTDEPRTITEAARRLLADIDVTNGLRLLGVGVSALSEFAQDGLFPVIGTAEPDPPPPSRPAPEQPPPPPPGTDWRTGQDIRHDDHGPGWVWGAGLGRVTVRFEGPLTPPGPVRTFKADDPALHRADPPNWI
ncbi:DNA polymerase IV [Dactylosporangium matsuzakiense]|uniref:DNA polymerase IV n=2 Tax=Dactylosporangium matsuzakiense TaxID=53360 RepID=A0A9W6NN14_9ACTN|nr:DNA polymerase IV [Dactylosporangium matsuzakiense]UWZ49243.1 DNA polymerase IV [Dactylosporangium matsuzakiense]GLL03475.1 DNA polymerase IV [Dactylosporangium matsuzakiense]